MKQETKTCQNCKKEFTIEPEDFDFYEKIKVPPPTWCPDCRLIRRMMFRNERSLYKRKCNATGKEIISMFSSDKPLKVYERNYWWSDKWDPIEYGRDYDFSESFFKQFRKLLEGVPILNLTNKSDVDCQYCNWGKNIKNCYLSVRLHDVENCLYSLGVAYTKDSVNVEFTRNSELCYETVDCSNCYKLFFSRYCEFCNESFLLYNCKNCSNCFGCANLRNKQYQIFNRQYSKEEYLEKLKGLDIGSFEKFLQLKKEFSDLIIRYPYKFAQIIRSVNVLGDNLRNVKDCICCFDCAKDIENCKYMLYAVDGARDCYDGMFMGLNSELNCEVVSFQGAKCLSALFVLGQNQSLYYSINCHDSSHLFGCVGLRHKQYCILNKQYTKEEYERLVPKIIEHMNEMPYIDKKGRVYKYGEFFPPELSPFCYNETIAQEYFPLTKEQALEQGYCWKEPEERDIKIDLKSEQLPDNIKDVDDSIIGKVIECVNAPAKISKGNLDGQVSQCTTAFKIIEPEFQFYRRMNLPLPRLCPNCRHYQRLKQRNPLKLWHRKCQCAGAKSSNGVYTNTIAHFHATEPCPNEFETTYAPDKPEIVYCESCYLREVV